MNVGDLVIFDPARHTGGASLTMIKHCMRKKERIGDKPGVVVSVEGKYSQVAFGTEILILHQMFLKIIK